MILLAIPAGFEPATHGVEILRLATALQLIAKVQNFFAELQRSRRQRFFSSRLSPLWCRRGRRVHS